MFEINKIHMYLFNVGIIFSRSFKEGNVEGIRVFFSRCVIHHFFRSLKITVFTDNKTFKNPIQNTNTNQISRRLKLQNYCIPKDQKKLFTISHLFPTRSLLTDSDAYRSISWSHCLTLLNES